MLRSGLRATLPWLRCGFDSRHPLRGALVQAPCRLAAGALNTEATPNVLVSGTQFKAGLHLLLVPG